MPRFGFRQIRGRDSLWSRGLVICLVFVFGIGVAQDDRIAFNHLTIKNGLSDGRVDCILQDSYGFLWFGTQDGLNRYDGYNFTVFDHDVFDSTSISSNWIRCIFEDKNRNLWIGTEGGGLNQFDYENEQFIRWTNQPDNPQSLDDNFVRAIYEDSFGILWIGTRTGLSQFNRKKNIFAPFHHEPFNLTSLTFDENVTSIFEDREHNIWIGTQDWIYRYDRQNQKVEHLNFNNQAERITAVFEDSYGDIWIGSRYNGLMLFDRKTNSLRQFQKEADDPFSLGSNEIKNIFEDRDRNLWIATFQGGINLYDRRTGHFRHYQNDPNDPSSLSSNSVRIIYQDRTGVIWIGMDGSGIDSFVKNRQKFQCYGNRVDDPYNLSPNTILAIYEDREGMLWLGTEGGGLNKFDRKRVRCIHYQFRQGQPYSLSSNQVTCIFKDSVGILWIGTKEGLNRCDRQGRSFQRYYNRNTPITGNNFINVISEDKSGNLLLGTNNGIVLFNKATGEFSSFDYDNSGLLNNEVVLSIIIDKSGKFWIGYLRSGLVVYDPAAEKFIHYHSDAGKTNSLSNNFVQSVYQDRNGYIWVATRNGLNRLDPATGVFRQYTKTEGLPSNVIVGILEDRDGNLWLSTTNGLSRFNPAKEVFTNYDISEGLQGNQFWINSCFKSRSGELFFGGNNGFNSFFPERLEELSNPHVPPIVITNVSVFDRPVLKGVVAFSLGQATLRLSYRENRISFEFAALDFTFPEKNQYAYWLRGFDKDWIHAGTRRYANYTNLDPGFYTFIVKGSNNDGVWNESGTAISFLIGTPFWRTWWAFILYGVLAVGLVYGINVYFIGLVRARHDLKLERLEKEKAEEVNRFKLQFFTDVAHEFKTPLTLIRAPLEDIIRSTKKDFPFENEFRLMYRNVKYLLRLVHQLLSFRRAEQGRMELKVSKGDLVQFATEIFGLFRETARRHSIDYRFNAVPEVIEGWFDWEKLEEILVNVIDNAFKYTADKGSITVNLTASEKTEDVGPRVIINICDTGVGISRENLDHIFDRFYLAKNSHYPDQVSSGLGLALTKRLVELHRGQIMVESQEGRGSKFSIALPLGREHLREEEIIADISETAHFRLLMESSEQEVGLVQHQEAEFNEARIDSNDPLILLVEDNNELRTYMRKVLGRSYRIAEAGNGREGLETARKIMPNIIISDIIMPLLDGIEMCRQLKSDLATSHIPVILLTARAALDLKIKGLETGADDYIEKPFHFRFLEARIKNILQSREKLRERYRQELILQTAEIVPSSTDEKFLINIKKTVEEHLADDTLNIKQLSSEVGLSRTKLFIKLKALTGYSPKEFIRTMRLETASQLLKKTDLTVSEIAYQVGFKYPKYFSTCYQRQYHLTPSEYRARNAGNA